MARTITYHPQAEYAGRKISEFLRNQGYTRQNLTTLRYDEGSITLNGTVLHMNQLLSCGDELTVRIRDKNSSENVLPVDLPFPIVYEDEDLAVINKPAGMPSHPSMKNFDNTLGNAAAFRYGADGDFIYRCVNRLDKDTTGLTIIARHMVSGGILYEEIQRKELKRDYTAIVEGEDLPDEGTIDLPLARDLDSAIARKVDFENGDRAVTHYKVLKRGNGLSCVRCHLETGRTHQIRVHMLAIGHPLIGDFLYNPEDKRMTRQALHAGKLSFIHPMTGENLCFEVPLPEDMQAILNSMQTV